jgi:hypothetical protein
MCYVLLRTPGSRPPAPARRPRLRLRPGTGLRTPGSGAPGLRAPAPGEPGGSPREQQQQGAGKKTQAKHQTRGNQQQATSNKSNKHQATSNMPGRPRPRPAPTRAPLRRCLAVGWLLLVLVAVVCCCCPRECVEGAQRPETRGPPCCPYRTAH